MYLGDYTQNSLVNLKFTTRDTNSILSTFTSGALTVYKGTGTTNTNSGVVLTTNFNSVTGLNHAYIDTSINAGFYATGSDFQIVVLSGTVSSTSVVGETLGLFSIRNRSNVLDETNGVENNYTLRQALRLILASTCAKLSGADSTTVYIRDINDTKNRIVATVTSTGNRTAITTDVT